MENEFTGCGPFLHDDPRDRPLAVYGGRTTIHLGGGRENSASVLECFDLIREISGYEVKWSYDERNRIGDHICYISNLNKLKAHFPSWSITHALPSIVEEMIRAEEKKLVTA